jgi:hypothetical protein
MAVCEYLVNSIKLVCPYVYLRRHIYVFMHELIHTYVN